jgi:hypothetical protein
MKISWPSEVTEKLNEMIADMPLIYHKYLTAARPGAEVIAHRQGKSEVDEDSMVRGFITSVPRHLRDGIEETLGQHNFDLQYYRPAFDEPSPLTNHQPNRPQ